MQINGDTYYLLNNIDVESPEMMMKPNKIEIFSITIEKKALKANLKYNVNNITIKDGQLYGNITDNGNYLQSQMLTDTKKYYYKKNEQGVALSAATSSSGVAKELPKKQTHKSAAEAVQVAPAKTVDVKEPAKTAQVVPAVVDEKAAVDALPENILTENGNYYLFSNIEKESKDMVGPDKVNIQLFTRNSVDTNNFAKPALVVSSDVVKNKENDNYTVTLIDKNGVATISVPLGMERAKKLYYKKNEQGVAVNAAALVQGPVAPAAVEKAVKAAVEEAKAVKALAVKALADARLAKAEAKATAKATANAVNSDDVLGNKSGEKQKSVAEGKVAAAQQKEVVPVQTQVQTPAAAALLLAQQNLQEAINESGRLIRYPQQVTLSDIHDANVLAVATAALLLAQQNYQEEVDGANASPSRDSIASNDRVVATANALLLAKNSLQKEVKESNDVPLDKSQAGAFTISSTINLTAATEALRLAQQTHQEAVNVAKDTIHSLSKLNTNPQKMIDLLNELMKTGRTFTLSGINNKFDKNSRIATSFNYNDEEKKYIIKIQDGKKTYDKFILIKDADKYSIKITPPKGGKSRKRMKRAGRLTKKRVLVKHETNRFAKHCAKHSTKRCKKRGTKHGAKHCAKQGAKQSKKKKEGVNRRTKRK